MRATKAVLIGSMLLGSVVGWVSTARADGSQSTPISSEADGGVCMGNPAIPLDRADMIGKLQAKLAAEAPTPDGDVVMLNSRGYRYDSDRAPAIARDLQLLEIEFRRARAAAKQGGQTQP